MRNNNQLTSMGWFTRAFGATSGVVIAMIAVAVGIPILACGGCLTMALTGDSDSGSEIQNVPVKRDIENAAERLIITSLPEVDLEQTIGASPVVDMTAKISDGRINDVRLLDMSPPFGSVDVLMENKGEAPWRPRVVLRFYNAYGAEIGHGSINWIVTPLMIGERYAEQVNIRMYDVDDVMRYSQLTISSDFSDCKYVLCEYGAK